MYKTAREQAGLSQEYVALHIPCDRTTLSRIESFKIPASLETAKRIADICHRPQLTAWYCSEECAIGRTYCYKIKKRPLSETALEIKHWLNEVEKHRPLLTKIARDGVITPDEMDCAIRCTEAIMELEKAIEEYKLAMADALDIPELVRAINKEQTPNRQARRSA